MSFAPAESAVLGVPGSVVQLLMLVVALIAFSLVCHRRLVPLLRARPDPRTDQPSWRLARTLWIGFGQARQPRYPVAGLLHILIFFGFLILSLRSLTLLGEGLATGFTLPGLGGRSGDLYASIKDVTALVVLAACLVAAGRRAILRPARYHDRHAVRSHGGEAYVILGLISLLMVADAIHEGSMLAATTVGALASGAAVGAFLPFAGTTARLLAGTDPATLRLLHLGSFWIHNAALLFFLCYLPVSKHFHVITSLPNVYLSDLTPGGRIKPPRHGEAASTPHELEPFGVGELEDFTWKHLLDFYSCTDCGRCSDSCPAYAVGTPLSPRMISVKSRDLLYDSYPILGPVVPTGDRPPLLGEVIDEGELWACTTCGACEDACPILIEYVDKIVDMRRFLVDEGRVPRSLQGAMADLERRGNPYGKSPRRRSDWLRGGGSDGSGPTIRDAGRGGGNEERSDGGGSDGPDIRVLDVGDEAEVLLFADSCAAYDPRIQEIGRTYGRLLGTAGLDVGTLGDDEVDSGHEARRLGEEGLFEELRDANLEAIGARGCERVTTIDPHAYNALRHDYGLQRPVRHHSELLAELVADGRLPLGRLDDDRTYTFHDPCYLGRHNNVYDAPRQVLAAIPGLGCVEMERSRNRSFCCGGGSLYLFYEGESERRMGEARLEMVEEVGADVVVTACPFCLINLEDAAKTSGREADVEVVDLAELVARSVANRDEEKEARQP